MRFNENPQKISSALLKSGTALLQLEHQDNLHRSSHMTTSTSSGNNLTSQVICSLLIQIFNIPRVNFKFEVCRIFRFILSEQKTLDACFLQYMIHMYCSILLNESCLRGNTHIATRWLTYGKKVQDLKMNLHHHVRTLTIV